MLNIDLMLLESWKRFERFCTHLARDEFPNAINTRGVWDGGRDLFVWSALGWDGDVVWQCEFIKQFDATNKRAILKSIKDAVAHYEEFAALLAKRLEEDEPYRKLLANNAAALGKPDGPPRMAKWILCVPIEKTGPLLDWLRIELEPYPFEWEVWDSTDLLERLEKRPDILDRYFYPVFADLQRHFQRDELELMRFEIDTVTEQQWDQMDASVLEFASTGGVHDPDLVFDVILRNRGQLDTFVSSIAATIEWKTWKPHGIPGDGLLHPQITYSVSVGHGAEGSYVTKCEPPLVVRAGGVERFKLRLRDTGYAWRGSVRLSLAFGTGKRLFLPHIGLYT